MILRMIPAVPQTAAGLFLAGACLAMAGEAVPATVVMISCDGFRFDYQDLAETPTLDRLAAGGVRAEALVPPFPAETFPGHYTLATGLHPEHNGIVSNYMWDPEFDAFYGARGGREETFRSRWWEGEPIWVTAHRRGLVTASYFWVGTEAVIQGVQPDYWYPFTHEVTHEAEVDQVLAWLDLPPAERPRLVNLYFTEPNSAGHRYGPTAPETLEAVRRVDAVLGRLVDGLEARGIFERTNLVIVSDHGMADVSPERVIRLEDHVDLDQIAFVNSGTTLHVVPKPGFEQSVYEALVGAHPRLDVYRKGEVPERFHFAAHRRVTPIVGIPHNGWMVGTGEELEAVAAGRLKGAHGFDNRHPDMLGIFYAHGPAFRRGARTGPVAAVDVYQVVAAALGIEPAPHDGDPAVLGRVLLGEQDDLGAAVDPASEEVVAPDSVGQGQTMGDEGGEPVLVSHGER